MFPAVIVWPSWWWSYAVSQSSVVCSSSRLQTTGQNFHAFHSSTRYLRILRQPSGALHLHTTVRQVILPSHHSPWRQSSGVIQLIISVAFTKCPIIQMELWSLQKWCVKPFALLCQFLGRKRLHQLLHSKQLKWPCSPRNEKFYFCNSVQLVLQNVQLHFYIYWQGQNKSKALKHYLFLVRSVRMVASIQFKCDSDMYVQCTYIVLFTLTLHYWQLISIGLVTIVKTCFYQSLKNARYPTLVLYPDLYSIV